jgi:peptide/nickel transport system permease protein
MARFVLLRFLSAIPTLLLVSIAVFAMIRAVPGDPVAVMLGEGASAEAVEALRARLGLDLPVTVQYFRWLGGVLTGDLGQSIQNGRPVLDIVISRFLVSLPVVGLAIIVAVVIAVPLGIYAGSRRGQSRDLGIVGIATLSMSIPSFWMGMMLLLFFGLKLRWLPVLGYTTNAQDGWDTLIVMILPVTTLVLAEIGVIIRMTRASTIEVMGQDYITHARAKGLPQGLILRRHVLPNSFAPTLTLIGLILGSLLGGVAVIETVFTIPGLGRLLVDSIFTRDYPVLQGCLLFVATIYVLVNAVVDALYPLFDPRVAAA